ncbi:MAG: CADD family putative folate metabolism protein [Bdellovibrionota bacterium]
MNQTNQFAQEIAALHLLNHPFYQDWMAGKLSRPVLQDYATQYATHVNAFPRYIGAIHSMSENPVARKIMLENLNDEEGVSYGVSHPELWLRFAEGLGVNREEINVASPRPAIQKVVATFFKHSRSSFHEGLGALYAYESQVPEIAHSKIEGLQKNYGVTDSRTLEFFEVHKHADVYHREAVEGLLNALPENQKIDALKAAKEAAQSLWDFLTDVHKENNYAMV